MFYNFAAISGTIFVIIKIFENKINLKNNDNLATITPS